MRGCSLSPIPNLSLTFTIVLLSTVHAVELKCAGIDYPFDIIPPGDNYIEYGSSLDIYCKLNLNHSEADGFTSKDLHFHTFRNLSRSHVESAILNDTTIGATLHNLSLGSHSYYCSLNNSPTCYITVNVGYKPREVKNFTCESWNWEKLVCKWDTPDNGIDTKYSLTYSLKGRAGRTPSPCPNSSDVENNTCTFTTTTDPPYRQGHEDFKFTITGRNRLGTSTKDIYFDHFSHVKPDRPTSVRVVNQTLGSALITWKVRHPMETFPRGLTIKLAYKSKYDPPDMWNIVTVIGKDGGKAADRGKIKNMYNITGLKYANAPYDVRVYLKPQGASDNFWSEPGNVSFTTPSTIPGMAPRTTFGSFDIVSRGNGTDVFVYWNRIPEYMQNGREFRYNVTCLMNNNTDCGLPIEKTLSYAKYAIMNDNEYLFSIYSVNKVGRSKDSSQVFVPKFGSIPVPESFTKVAYENGVHELSWKPIHHKDLSGYTIFWCEDERDLPVPCKGIIDWVDVGKNITEKNITMKSDTKFYKFAIAANLNNGTSSGMIWSSCIIFHDKVLKVVDDVRVSKVDSREADISWEIRCAQSSSFGGFNLYYCPVKLLSFLPKSDTQNNECLENHNEQTLLVNQSYVRNVTLRNLIPYTTYKVQMSIISYDGARQRQYEPRSAPKRFTTLEDAPSEPLNLRTVDVTNSSIIIAWDVPKETNGILQIYKLFIESQTHHPKSPISFEAKNSDGNTPITEREITGLYSYTPYHLTLKACTGTSTSIRCSEPSSALIVRTSVGAPEKMRSPHITFTNNSVAYVTWEPPAVASGNLDYYELSVSINGSYDEIVKFTGSHGEIQLPNCDADGSAAFRIRAVNVDGNSVYKGPWSEPFLSSCGATGWAKNIALFAWIIGICTFSFMSVVLFYIVKRGWHRCRKMKDVEVKLPPGLQSQDLEKDSQDYIDLERWPPRPNATIQASLSPGLAPDEESLLGKKSDESSDVTFRFDIGAKNGGDSSGCSVGRGSVSSSAASDNGASSDSGAEADQCLSSIGAPFAEWQAVNINNSIQNGVGGHQGQRGSNGDERVNFSNFGDWDPGEPAVPGYTRVGFTDGTTPDKSLTGKGYVPIANITSWSPPQKTTNNRNSQNSLPLDSSSQFVDQEHRPPDVGVGSINLHTNAAPNYVTLTCLQEQKTEESVIPNTLLSGSSTETKKSHIQNESFNEVPENLAQYEDSSENETENVTDNEIPLTNISGPMPPYVSMIENPTPAAGNKEEEEQEQEKEEDDENKQERISPSIGLSKNNTVNEIDSDVVDGLNKDKESHSNYIPHHIFRKESLHTQ